MIRSALNLPFLSCLLCLRAGLLMVSSCPSVLEDCFLLPQWTLLAQMASTSAETFLHGHLPFPSSAKILPHADALFRHTPVLCCCIEHALCSPKPSAKNATLDASWRTSILPARAGAQPDFRARRAQEDGHFCPSLGSAEPLSCPC